MSRLGYLGVLLGLFLVAQTLADTSKSNATSSTTTERAKSLPQQPECARVEEYFVKHKIGHANLVPKNKIHDPEMEICYKGDDDKYKNKQTCCTRRMERKFTTSAEKDFYEVIRSTSSYLKNLIASNSAQYQEQFLTMIRDAENNTETLFSEVYKMPLKDRRAPVENLFMDLQAFIKHKEVNIHESVAQFFDELFPLVFHNILNDPTLTTLNEDYKECLMEIRQQVNPHPFGDNPNKIAHHLSKSLTVARSFLEALSLGIEAINTTDYIPLETHCTKALTKLQHCSACQGHTAVRPCKNYCLNVMRGCLATVSQLDSHWNSFVDAVEKLTAHMKGPYSIEDVLHVLDDKISAAIMHAMETGHKFYAKVIAKCGHPKTSKAATNPGPLQKNMAAIHRDTPNKEVKLQTRISNLMRSLTASKGFYHNLADTMCNTAKFSDGSADRCWNGHDTHRYNKNVTEFSLAAQLNHNPEMHITQTRASVLTTLTDKLIHITKLLESKSTADTEQSDSWPYKYTHYYGSGDGTQGDDEDDYEDDASGSGSGGGGYGYRERTDHGRGRGNTNGEDIYIEGESGKKANEPSVVVKPAESKPGNGAAGFLQTSSSFHFSLLCLISLALWLNG